MRPQATYRLTAQDRWAIVGKMATAIVGLLLATAIVYTIATVPAGWWIEGGLQWTAQ